MYEVPHVAARASTSVQPRALKLRLLALVMPALATPCACRGQLERIGYYADAGRPSPALDRADAAGPAGGSGGSGGSAGAAPSPSPAPGPAGADPPQPPPPAIDAAPATPAAPPRPRTALLVVGDPTKLTGADTKIKVRIEGLGFTVTAVDDGGPAEAAAAVGLVVIASSSSSSTVAGKFRSTPVPVIVLDAFILDDMSMTGNIENSDYGTDNGANIVVASTGHPLTAGLKEATAVASANAELNWGRPGAGATLAAALPENSEHAAIFAYEKDAAMAGFTAPARRVGFFASATLSDRINDNGLKLFDAAIAWSFEQWTKNN